MAFCSDLKAKPVGEFREMNFKNHFHYTNAEEGEFIPWPEYPQKLWVQPDSFLWCKVKKTVAHVVSDEAADGSPVVDKWYFTNHYQY
jgi:hypothetical protein